MGTLFCSSCIFFQFIADNPDLFDAELDDGDFLDAFELDTVCAVRHLLLYTTLLYSIYCHYDAAWESINVEK